MLIGRCCVPLNVHNPNYTLPTSYCNRIRLSYDSLQPIFSVSFGFFVFFFFAFVSHLFWFLRIWRIGCGEMCWNPHPNNCAFSNFNKTYEQNCTCLHRRRSQHSMLVLVDVPKYVRLPLPRVTPLSPTLLNKQVIYPTTLSFKPIAVANLFHRNLSRFSAIFMWCNDQSTNENVILPQSLKWAFGARNYSSHDLNGFFFCFDEQIGNGNCKRDSIMKKRIAFHIWQQ